MHRGAVPWPPGFECAGPGLSPPASECRTCVESLAFGSACLRCPLFLGRPDAASLFRPAGFNPPAVAAAPACRFSLKLGAGRALPIRLFGLRGHVGERRCQQDGRRHADDLKESFDHERLLRDLPLLPAIPSSAPTRRVLTTGRGLHNAPGRGASCPSELIKRRGNPLLTGVKFLSVSEPLGRFGHFAPIGQHGERPHA